MLRSRSSGRVLVLCLALIVSGIVSWGVDAQTVTLTFVHEAPETHIKGRGANMVAELAAKYSNGQIKINVFPAAQLVGALDEVPAAVRGEVDLIAPYFNYVTAIDPAFDVLFVPLLFDSNEEAIAFMDGPLGAELLDRLESRGLKGLGMWYEAPTHIWVRGDSPIRSLEDMQGRRLRVFPSAPLEAGLRRLGVIPTLLPPADVFLALQQGLVEGVITSPTYAAPAGWAEVLSHGTRVPISVGGYAVAASRRTWQRLSSEHREIIERAVREVTAWNRTAVRKELEESYEWLRRDGVQLWDVDEAELERWREAVRPVYNEVHPDLQEVIRKVQAAKNQ